MFSRFVYSHEVRAIGIILLPGGKELEELAIANNRVERRTQLMAHISEKLTFYLTGRDRDFLSTDQILVNSPNFGFHTLTFPNFQQQGFTGRRQFRLAVTDFPAFKASSQT